MNSAIKTVVELMELSARTAPKGWGMDFVVIKTLWDDNIYALGNAMVSWGKEKNDPLYIRDGNSVVKSDAVLLIGIKDPDTAGLNCGACGFDSCSKVNPEEHGQFKGPSCLIRVLDMGIAIGSAVKTAGIHNIDNRIMYRAGMVARKLKLIDADYVMGIPLSATGKSIYFDR
ncbi:ferredoxin domain-containing protein [[Eubacterium] cellulosolvens]